MIILEEGTSLLGLSPCLGHILGISLIVLCILIVIQEKMGIKIQTLIWLELYMWKR